MKLKSQNQTNGPVRQFAGAFTLIEMIGVLAVIAILAALLIPKVFTAINNARINNAVASVETIKTAVADHYGKYGSFALYGTNYSILPSTNYDTAVLMAEGLLDKPFAVKVGTGSYIEIVTNGGNGGTGYKLDGTNNLTGTQTYTVEAVLQGVAGQDALDIGTLLDGLPGTILSPATNSTGADQVGRVEYTGGSGLQTVYIYITGR
jgi:type II secretory pathway pseudopilin PulG